MRAAGRAVRVFKRVSVLGDISPFWVSEGGLEHGNRCDLPGSGKSCNKGNTSRGHVPGYSAACSLFRPPPGLLMREAFVSATCSRVVDHSRATAAADGSSAMQMLSARPGLSSAWAWRRTRRTWFCTRASSGAIRQPHAERGVLARDAQAFPLMPNSGRCRGAYLCKFWNTPHALPALRATAVEP
jgi:hypothetical protein